MPPRKPQPPKNNFWGMVTTSSVETISGGQVGLVILGILGAIGLLKMSQADVGKLAFLLVEELKARYLICFAVWFITMIGWFIHANWLIKRKDKEMERLAKGRTDHQIKKRGKKLEGSES